jgi:hypothetical protein
MSEPTGGSSNSSSTLIDSLLTGDRQGIGGIICNDASGLCLAAKGYYQSSISNIAAAGDDGVSANPVDASGVYTSLMKLASQLSAAKNDGAALQSTSTQSDRQQSSSQLSSPWISLECATACVLIKENDSHVVAVRVPSTDAKGRSGSEGN